MLAWIEFAVAAAAIMFISERLTRCADILAYRLGIGRGFIGVIMLGAVTSLPELVTSLASIGVADSADLAVGNVFGSNLFNVLIIAVLDFFYRERSFDTGNVLTAVLATGVALLAIAGLIFGADAGGVGHVSWFSVAVVVTYVISMRLLYRHDRAEMEETGSHHLSDPGGGIATSRVVLRTLAAAGIVILAGVVATHAVGQIAEQHELGDSFAGGLFLAAATSLPELVVSLAAVRMGATSMAAGNIFGSNLFNLAILPVADLFVGQQLFGSVEPRPHLVLALGGLLLSCLAMTGFLMGKRRPTAGPVGMESLAIIVAYLLALWANFLLA